MWVISCLGGGLHSLSALRYMRGGLFTQRRGHCSGPNAQPRSARSIHANHSAFGGIFTLFISNSAIPIVIAFILLFIAEHTQKHFHVRSHELT